MCFCKEFILRLGITAIISEEQKEERKLSFSVPQNSVYKHPFFFSEERITRFLEGPLTTKGLRTNTLYWSHLSCWNKASLSLK